MRPFQEAIMEALYQSKSQRQRQRQGLAWFRALLSIFWLQSTNDLINRSQSCPFFLWICWVSHYIWFCVVWNFYFACGVEQNQGLRESQFSSFWETRNQKILDWLLYESSTIICLQVIFVYLFFSFLLNFCLDWTKWTFEVSKCILELFLLTGSFLFKIRSSGLEMKNLWICIWRDLVMLAIVPSSLPELTTVEMVYCYL